MLLLTPNRPESLIVSSVKNLINSFSSKQQRQISYHEQHLGGPKTAAGFLVAVAKFYSAEKYEHFQPYLDSIIRVFSRNFVHGSSLIIPFSYFNIFPVHLLRDHLLVHGSRLNELIMNNYYVDTSSFSFDDFLESMADWCSPKLKRLTLPKWQGRTINVITQRGVSALIRTVSATLEELNLNDCTFASVDLLLNLFSNLPKLKRLSLNYIHVVYSNDEDMAKLPVPTNLDELQHLYVCNFFHNNCYSACVNSHQILEWGRLVEHLPRLKTFHLVLWYLYQSREEKWLHSVNRGLMNRKWEPLEYLRIPVDTSRKRSIVYSAQNARRVSTDETVAQISTVLNDHWGRDSNNYLPYNLLYNLKTAWKVSLREYDVESIRQMFEVINCHLIPRYINVHRVFEMCSEFLEVVIVERPELSQKLGITSSFVDNFLTAIMTPEIENPPIHPICTVFAVYSETISVSNFERIFKRVIRHLGEQSRMYSARMKMFSFLGWAVESCYCTLEHWRVMRNVLGPDYESVTRNFQFFKDEQCNRIIGDFVEKMREFDEKYEPLKAVSRKRKNSSSGDEEKRCLLKR